MEFKDTILKTYPTGSRYIYNPPVVGTDNDTIVLVNGYHDYETMLIKEGWGQDGEYVGSEFTSYRKGSENYIVTESEEFFLSFVKATEGAKALNLTNKQDRITLFQAVNSADGKPKLDIDVWDNAFFRQWNGVRIEGAANLQHYDVAVEPPRLADNEGERMHPDKYRRWFKNLRP